MDTALLSGKTITSILSPACHSVHPAWINELTTPIAISKAVLQFSDGGLALVAPCEVEVETSRYPSLGLAISKCNKDALTWQAPNGETFSMQPLALAIAVLPLSVVRAESSDPLGEGTVSQVVLVGAFNVRVVFRHIMPPMTLGIALEHGSST